MKFSRIFFIFLTLTVASYTYFYFTERQKAKASSASDASLNIEENIYEPLNYQNVKAMWLTQYDLCNVYKSGEHIFRDRISKIFENCKRIGINTVIVQVRPNADSMYPSELFTPSSYAVGEYGTDFKYDPFRIIIDEAHKKELSVHAWINPLRAMMEHEIELVSEKYQIKKWWNDPTKNTYLPTVNGRIYLNPAYSEVRKLIVDGVREITNNYCIDGIHMDDYFYPTTESEFDIQSYQELGNGLSLGDFRRNNVNLLVFEIYSAVKEKDKKLLFGISPAGTIEKNYNELYADVYTWCSSDGYIDYICPQLYFGFEHTTCAFDTLLNKWSSIIKTDSVSLWVGISLEKAVNASNGIGDKWAGDVGYSEWMRHNDIIKRALEYTKSVDRCVGVSLFSYQYFYDPMTDVENAYSKSERDNFLPLLKSIKWK